MPAVPSSVRRALRVGALGCLAATPCVALADPLAAEPAWLLRAAVDAGEQDSRGASLAVDYAPVDRPYSFGASVQHAEAALAGPAQPGSSSPRTLAVGADAGWLFGPALLTLGFDTTDDEDFRRSDRWTAGLRVGRGAFGATARVSRRATDFDPVPIAGTYTLRSGQTIALGGSVSCDADDTGYGLAFDWSGDRWSAYVSGTAYDYDPLSCAYTANVPAELRRLNARGLGALSATAARRFEPRAGGRIGRGLQLLESEFGAGAAWRFDVVTVGVDWFHGEEEFSGLAQDDWSATLGFPLGAAWKLEFTAGRVDFDGDASGYGGLALSVRL